MNKYTKTIIIILVALFVFFVTMILLLDNDEVVFQSNKNEAYLVVGQNAMFSYHNKKFYNVPLASQIGDELDWQKFKVYENYKEKGSYLMHYDQEWYLFTDKREAVNYDINSLIAYISNYNIDYIYKEPTAIIDKKYVDKIADANGVIASNLTVSQEVNMDIDKDGKNETFYSFSTALPIEPTDNKEYSIVFMVKDEKIYPIYSTLNSKYLGTYCQSNIEGFVNLNTNNTYEIIVSCSTMGVNEQRVNLYELNKNNGKLEFELKASNS